MLDTCEFDGVPIWRLSEGKNGIVKLELTWQPPVQQKQHKQLQKKTPGKKKEAESGHSTGIRSSGKTAPPADEWHRQPSPARAPPPKPAPPVLPPPKTPAKSPTIEMVSPPGTPDITPPSGSRWTPKTPTKSPPSHLQEEDPFYGYTEDDDRSSSLQKYKVSKILHTGTPEISLFSYQLQYLQMPERKLAYVTVSSDEPFASFFKPPESKYHNPEPWSLADTKLQVPNRELKTTHKEGVSEDTGRSSYDAMHAC